MLSRFTHPNRSTVQCSMNVSNCMWLQFHVNKPVSPCRIRSDYAYMKTAIASLIVQPPSINPKQPSTLASR